MDKLDILAKLKEEKVVAVVRAESKEQGEKIIDSIVKGGINFIEITMTVPGAVDIIKELSEKYKSNPDVIIGAGTVLDPETARMVILAGAKYVVSPSFNPETVKMCNRYRVPVMPGIMTVKEAVEALELGVDILKVFPGNAFGPSIIKAFKGPLPQACFMPTGGVSVENAQEWIKNGAVAIGTGSNLTAGAKTGDYESITKIASDFVNAVK
ncbi:MAG: bifunctional 4-hydroxy-2-oxoglutarate aldolase/2-dehydro-3-deoxy-phosphogluconate aldolase [Clostridia bacterium]|nr:bifunctional 4-hydroxy-2-oxoglutarate aldolase/2-dehydro-3-deoxy-phosphogluconate aldolase [Clostridia bacterium]